MKHRLGALLLLVAITLAGCGAKEEDAVADTSVPEKEEESIADTSAPAADTEDSINWVEDVYNGITFQRDEENTFSIKNSGMAQLYVSKDVLEVAHINFYYLDKCSLTDFEKTAEAVIKGDAAALAELGEVMPGEVSTVNVNQNSAASYQQVYNVAGGDKTIIVHYVCLHDGNNAAYLLAYQANEDTYDKYFNDFAILIESIDYV